MKKLATQLLQSSLSEASVSSVSSMKDTNMKEAYNSVIEALGSVYRDRSLKLNNGSKVSIDNIDLNGNLSVKVMKEPNNKYEYSYIFNFKLKDVE